MAKTGIVSKTLTAVGSISAADIVGTGEGQLGHANGYPVVPSYGPNDIVEFVSAVVVMKFDTVAYGGGGNTGIKLSGGGAALSGVAANTDFIRASADKAVQFVPLAATFLVPVADKGLNFVTASAPTNPGTAAGTISYRVQYRVHRVNL